jgi:hypothetical protein
MSVFRIYSVRDGITNECGAVDGMRIGREDQSPQRKPAILSTANI